MGLGKEIGGKRGEENVDKGTEGKEIRGGKMASLSHTTLTSLCPSQHPDSQPVTSFHSLPILYIELKVKVR